MLTEQHSRSKRTPFQSLNNQELPITPEPLLVETHLKIPSPPPSFSKKPFPWVIFTQRKYASVHSVPHSAPPTTSVFKLKPKKSRRSYISQPTVIATGVSCRSQAQVKALALEQPDQVCGILASTKRHCQWMASSPLESCFPPDLASPREFDLPFTPKGYTRIKTTEINSDCTRSLKEVTVPDSDFDYELRDLTRATLGLSPSMLADLVELEQIAALLRSKRLPYDLTEQSAATIPDLISLQEIYLERSNWPASSETKPLQKRVEHVSKLASYSHSSALQENGYPAFDAHCCDISDFPIKYHLPRANDRTKAVSSQIAYKSNLRIGLNFDQFPLSRGSSEPMDACKWNLNDRMTGSVEVTDITKKSRFAKAKAIIWRPPVV